jgi:hypothetical protein
MADLSELALAQTNRMEQRFPSFCQYLHDDSISGYRRLLRSSGSNHKFWRRFGIVRTVVLTAIWRKSLSVLWRKLSTLSRSFVVLNDAAYL